MSNECVAGGEPRPTPAGSARVFVGIKLNPETAHELARIAKVLERSRVRLLAADDIHLTLVPPWQESSISRATETLQRAVADFGPFTLEVQHVGYGPDPRRPRLLSADCAAIGELEALRTALLAAYEQADERP